MYTHIVCDKPWIIVAIPLQLYSCVVYSYMLSKSLFFTEDDARIFCSCMCDLGEHGRVHKRGVITCNDCFKIGKFTVFTDVDCI